MNVHDQLLIWRFNRGDCDAVQVIYEKYKHELVAMAAGMLNNAAAGEDVVHDVFVAFLELKKFRLTGSLKGYLATCVANKARNLLRANGRRKQDSLDGADGISADIAAPDYEAIVGEENRLLSRAIAELPYAQREVVMLHLKGGMKFSEIANSQGISINTVQGRYRYGLEKLRSKLNGEVSTCNLTIQSKS